MLFHKLKAKLFPKHILTKTFKTKCYVNIFPNHI